MLMLVRFFFLRVPVSPELRPFFSFSTPLASPVPLPFSFRRHSFPPFVRVAVPPETPLVCLFCRVAYFYNRFGWLFFFHPSFFRLFPTTLSPKTSVFILWLSLFFGALFGTCNFPFTPLLSKIDGYYLAFFPPGKIFSPISAPPTLDLVFT